MLLGIPKVLCKFPIIIIIIVVVVVIVIIIFTESSWGDPILVITLDTK